MAHHDRRGKDFLSCGWADVQCVLYFRFLLRKGLVEREACRARRAMGGEDTSVFE